MITEIDSRNSRSVKKTTSRDMIRVIAVLSLALLSVSILTPVLPLYLTSIGISPEMLGLILSVAMLGMVIGETLWGWLADKMGPRVPLGVGTFVCAISVFSLSLSRSIPTIFTAFFLWGLVRSAIFAPSRGYIGANAPSVRKATWMAVVTVAVAVSRSLGSLPSGFMADKLGYQSVFWASAGFAILAGLIMITGPGKIRSKKSESPAIAPSSARDTQFPNEKLKLRSLIPLCVVTSLQFLGLGILMTFLPLSATQVVGVEATQVGILFTISGLSSTVMGIPMGILADRLGKRRLVILGLAVSAVAMMGIAFARTFPWLILFSIINGLGAVMFTSAALGLLSDIVPSSKQSTAMGLYGAVGEDSGIIAGSALGGFVWTGLGPQTTFLMGALASGLGALIGFRLIWKRDRRICSQ